VQGGPPPGTTFPGGRVTFILIAMHTQDLHQSVEVPRSGKFTKRLVVGTWLMIGRVRGASKDAKVPGCAQAYVHVHSGKTATVSFGCDFP
jgi:hypothetical protein